MNEWITPKEAARITKLSEKTLANMRWGRKNLPYTKLAPGKRGSVRYLLRDVLNFMNKGNVEVRKVG